MAGFYKKNQGQLIRTLSGIGMALVIAGLCIFVYQLLLRLVPEAGSEFNTDVSAVTEGKFVLAERWPPTKLGSGLQERYPAGRVIDRGVKSDMESFYAANANLERSFRVRSTTGVGYARWIHYGVPALLFVAGAVLIVYLLNMPKFADFLIATEGEMKKVSWSSSGELVGSTAIVIGTVIVLGVFIFVADYAITFTLNLINVY